jgi:putative methanogenesis marker protein 6
LQIIGSKRNRLNSNETRIIVLSEEADLTTENLLSFARSLGEPVILKGTCFGIIVEGEGEAVHRIVQALKRKAPYSVFTKERGYCIGDKRKCRKGEEGRISGAPRPGFYQLELESQMLSKVGRAMATVDSEAERINPGLKKASLSEEAAIELVRQVLSEMGSVKS